jgi:hypothetical protein
MQPGEQMRVLIKGEDVMGDVLERYVTFTVPEGATGAERLEAIGLVVEPDKSVSDIVDVPMLSPADEKEIFPGDLVLHLYEPVAQPDPRWLYIPALVVLFMVMMMQRRRDSRLYVNEGA